MKIKVSKHKLNIHYLACTCLPFFLVKILFASNLHVHVSAIHCFDFFSRLFLLYVMMHFFMLALWDSILCSQTILSLALLMQVPS